MRAPEVCQRHRRRDARGWVVRAPPDGPTEKLSSFPTESQATRARNHPAGVTQPPWPLDLKHRGWNGFFSHRSRIAPHWLRRRRPGRSLAAIARQPNICRFIWRPSQNFCRDETRPIRVPVRAVGRCESSAEGRRTGGIPNLRGRRASRSSQLSQVHARDESTLTGSSRTTVGEFVRSSNALVTAGHSAWTANPELRLFPSVRRRCASA